MQFKLSYLVVLFLNIYKVLFLNIYKVFTNIYYIFRLFKN